MNLETWSDFVSTIAALTGGGVVDLRTGERHDMIIVVRWRENGSARRYEHALSQIEMKAMPSAVQPCVFAQIENAVRRATAA